MMCMECSVELIYVQAMFRPGKARCEWTYSVITPQEVHNTPYCTKKVLYLTIHQPEHFPYYTFSSPHAREYDPPHHPQWNQTCFNVLSRASPRGCALNKLYVRIFNFISESLLYSFHAIPGKHFLPSSASCPPNPWNMLTQICSSIYFRIYIQYCQICIAVSIYGTFAFERRFLPHIFWQRREKSHSTYPDFKKATATFLSLSRRKGWVHISLHRVTNTHIRS